MAGKHNFTVEDLEDDERRAKSVSLITMVCSIVPALLYIIYFMIYLNPKSEDTLGYIFGVDQFYWIMEMVSNSNFKKKTGPGLTNWNEFKN